ncbi:MAG: hypothetical protein EAX81_04845 [Candidatus Thorarchaeota archaeon]|nr:hypothetical protein [Candidatus Thorarchaeota archaeon]
MTGNLFDKIQGAPWAHDAEDLVEQDWMDILGPKENWIRNILLVDRLPDALAIQTPPTGIMVAYLNRIWAYNWRMLPEDAPRLWLLTHGYPSYIDWPPAWHWNLGIRMLSSLADYIGSQTYGLMGADRGTQYPDGKKKLKRDTRIPFSSAPKYEQLLWDPDADYGGGREMDWVRFPGIIPFVPDADTNQLSWFTKMVIKMGYTTAALDALNSIAHENFRGLTEAVSAVLGAGAEHVIVYGPWPLHPPRKYVPIHRVSYIPAAIHMDLTNQPRRFWRRKTEQAKSEKRRWRRLPNYRWVTLGEVVHNTDVEMCDCPACQAARTKETDPRSIWRWGHMLHAGKEWQSRANRAKKRKQEPAPPEQSTRLWYQEPSYAVFRKCLHYPPEIQWRGIEDIIESIVFTETRMEVRFPDGVVVPSTEIVWSWWDEGHHWNWKWPFLEDS